ncbi:MAG: cytochrome C biogenesis protein [FCB group bacterium]|nr:cytochrome C biogenesis protein [FCB group bacterium]MBL7027296.1 cytochrome C biogenesis protein [Candidatus Neomarinimicrobiota bacterium]MBL7122266.1 cytochrome C biogenesis protein [Candidatus Neomarinimicrobiota bacterium]
MNSLFDTLTQAVSGQFGLAIAASFAWGVLSILLSPCHLTSVPLVIGYISRQNEATGKRSALLALTFALGILTSITLIGIVTASMGRLMGDVGMWGMWLGAIILIVFGLYLMDIINLGWIGWKMPETERAGYSGAILLGLVFGVGLGPCTFAFLAPVLSVVIPMAQDSFFKAIIIILSFGVGHSLVYVAGGGLAALIVRYIRWSGNNRGPVYVKRMLGLLVFISGVYFGYATL